MSNNSRLSWPNVALYVSFITLYIVPSHIFDSIGIPMASLILGIYLMAAVGYIFSTGVKISFLEFIYLLLIAGCCIYQKSINPIVLLTPIVVSRLFKDNSYHDIVNFLYHSKIVDIALLFTIIYSIVYGSSSGRFLHIGAYEVNVSGLGVFLLGLIFYKRNKYIGYLVFLFGCLSLSRNYYLALAVLLIHHILLKRKKNIKLKKYKNAHFFLWMMITSIILYFIGVAIQQRFISNGIVYETTLIGRITNFFDISNYFRFTVNVILINLFTSKIYYWFVGCKTAEFNIICYEYANRNGYWYRGNNPHNYVFSYIKLFGLAGIIDIYLVGEQLNRVCSNYNLGIFISLILYSVFLSMGFNGEWLFLSFSVLLLYSGITDKLEP